MEPIKIIIEIREGNLTAVIANADLRYAVVDYDKIEHEAPPVSGPFAPDTISDRLYTLYHDRNPEDEEIKDELKRLKF